MRERDVFLKMSCVYLEPLRLREYRFGTEYDMRAQDLILYWSRLIIDLLRMTGIV